MPFLQANTLNYSQKIFDFFGLDITKNIDTSFLSLVTNNAREIIMKNLKRKDIEINLHQTNFNLICNKYNLKQNETYFYHHNLTDRYVCSQNLINFVTDLLTQNANLIEEIKLENKKVELTPGAKDS